MSYIYPVITYHYISLSLTCPTFVKWVMIYFILETSKFRSWVSTWLIQIASIHTHREDQWLGLCSPWSKPDVCK